MKFSKNPIGFMVAFIFVAVVGLSVLDSVLTMIAVHVGTLAVIIALILVIFVVIPRVVMASRESRKFKP